MVSERPPEGGGGENSVIAKKKGERRDETTDEREIELAIPIVPKILSAAAIINALRRRESF